MIPGVGQREGVPLKSHQQQIVGPTLLYPVGTPSVSLSFLQCKCLNKPEEACEVSAFARFTHFLKAVSVHTQLLRKLGDMGLIGATGWFRVSRSNKVDDYVPVEKP